MLVATPLETALRTWTNGAISMAYLVVGLMFLAFWRETRQRIFIYFTTAFAILAIHRTVFALTFGEENWDEFSFAIRLLGYLVILGGIVDRRMGAASD